MCTRWWQRWRSETRRCCPCCRVLRNPGCRKPAGKAECACEPPCRLPRYFDVAVGKKINVSLTFLPGVSDIILNVTAPRGNSPVLPSVCIPIGLTCACSLSVRRPRVLQRHQARGPPPLPGGARGAHGELQDAQVRAHPYR